MLLLVALGFLQLPAAELLFAQNLPSTVSLGKPLPAHKPQICHGFMPSGSDNIWGQPKNGFCPKDWAIFATLPADHRVSSWPLASAGQVPIKPTCCPLPARDILKSEVIIASENCPEGFIATGSEYDQDENDSNPYVLRCSRINSNRYQLSPPHHGAYWGVGSAGWSAEPRIELGEVPPTLRFALGRGGKYKWNDRGCVGYPFGSLFWKKTSKNCNDQFFRTLQFRGLPGDPPEGTAVQMLPECSAISSRFDNQPRCITLVAR